MDKQLDRLNELMRLFVYILHPRRINVVCFEIGRFVRCYHFHIESAQDSNEAFVCSADLQFSGVFIDINQTNT